VFLVAKIRVKEKNNNVIISERQFKAFSVCESDIKTISALADDSLIVPELRKKNHIKYKKNKCKTLDNYLNYHISIHGYYNILALTVETIKIVKNNGLRLDNLILDKRYICIRPITGSLSFVYQPVVTSPIDSNIKSFVLEVIQSITNPDKKLKNELDECINFIENIDNNDYASLEKFIYERYPQIYQQIKSIESADGCSKQASTVSDDGRMHDAEEFGLIDGAYMLRLKDHSKIYIDSQNFSVGANPENDYFIGDNLGISRFHAIIKTTNGEYTLVDENSKNYTYVNDSRIQPYIPVMLKNGDLISFADDKYEFVIR